MFVFVGYSAGDICGERHPPERCGIAVWERGQHGSGKRRSLCRRHPQKVLVKRDTHFRVVWTDCFLMNEKKKEIWFYRQITSFCIVSLTTFKFFFFFVSLSMCIYCFLFFWTIELLSRTLRKDVEWGPNLHISNFEITWKCWTLRFIKEKRYFWDSGATVQAVDVKLQFFFYFYFSLSLSLSFSLEVTDIRKRSQFMWNLPWL